MSLPSHIFPAPSVLSTDLEAETILLEMGREHYFSLKGVARSFWRLIEANPATETAIVSLLAEYDVEEPVLRRDLETLWQQLAGQGLATSSQSAV